MKLGQLFRQIRTLDPANAEYFGKNELMHSLALRSRLYHGIAYVIDEDDTFKSRCNMAMVELEPVPEEEQIAEKEFGHYNNLETHGRVDVMADLGTMDAERLQKLIGDHARYTGSKRAAEILRSGTIIARLSQGDASRIQPRACRDGKGEGRHDAGRGVKVTGLLEIDRHDRDTLR